MLVSTLSTESLMEERLSRVAGQIPEVNDRISRLEERFTEADEKFSKVTVQMESLDKRLQDSEMKSEGRWERMSNQLDKLLHLASVPRYSESQAIVDSKKRFDSSVIPKSPLQIQDNPPPPRNDNSEKQDSGNRLEERFERVCSQLDKLLHLVSVPKDSESQRVVDSIYQVTPPTVPTSSIQFQESTPQLVKALQIPEHNTVVDLPEKEQELVTVEVNSRRKSAHKDQALHPHPSNQETNVSRQQFQSHQKPHGRYDNNDQSLYKSSWSQEQQDDDDLSTTLSFRDNLLKKLDLPIFDGSEAHTLLSVVDRYFSFGRYNVQKLDLVDLSSSEMVRSGFNEEIRHIPFPDWLNFKSTLWLLCNREYSQDYCSAPAIDHHILLNSSFFNGRNGSLLPSESMSSAARSTHQNGIKDPIHPGVKESVEPCRSIGTGSRNTTQEELLELISKIQVTARSSPMDTLGALALATETPTNELMKRMHVGRRGNIITNAIWQNILGQALYKFTIIWLLQAKGKAMFVLVGSSSTLVLNTLIFNCFVFSQIFNEIKSRGMEERADQLTELCRGPRSSDFTSSQGLNSTRVDTMTHDVTVVDLQRYNGEAVVGSFEDSCRFARKAHETIKHADDEHRHEFHAFQLGDKLCLGRREVDMIWKAFIRQKKKVQAIPVHSVDSNAIEEQSLMITD